MKKLIFILSTILLFSCVPNNPIVKPTRNYRVILTNNGNWTNSVIECDSFTMTSNTHITIYVDGIKSELYSKSILVNSTSIYK